MQLKYVVPAQLRSCLVFAFSAANDEPHNTNNNNPKPIRHWLFRIILPRVNVGMWDLTCLQPLNVGMELGLHP